MTKILSTVVLFFISLSSFAIEIPDGYWIAYLKSPAIPVRFEIKGGEFYINNAEERIHLKSKLIGKDSIQLLFPVFDSEIRIKLNPDGDYLFTGVWYNHSKGDYKMDFVVPRYDDVIMAPPIHTPLSGRWDTWFSKGTDIESYAIGVFEETNKNVITGTFLTNSGDYRFLQGYNYGFGKMNLSTFDGAHAYYFDLKFITDDSVVGTYYSGFRWSEPLVMRRNPNATLPDADSLTYLKKGYDGIKLKLVNTKGDTVSLDDEQYKNKVVVIQIMGTWCPNCVDETRFLNELYEKYHNQGLEVLGVAFERNDDYSSYIRNIARFTRDLDVHYQFVFGGSTKQSGDVFPMLDRIKSYPTGIYIDRQGKVRKIHTGFTGPGTGELYYQQNEELESFVKKLINE